MQGHIGSVLLLQANSLRFAMPSNLRDIQIGSFKTRLRRPAANWRSCSGHCNPVVPKHASHACHKLALALAHATRHALISRSYVLLQTYACLPPYPCPLLLFPPQRLLPGEAIPAGAAKPRCARLFSTLAVSMAVTAASYPLLPALPPALSMACRATAHIEAQHLMSKLSANLHHF